MAIRPRAARRYRGPTAIRPRGGPGHRRGRWFLLHSGPELGFEIHAGYLAAARDRAVEAGIAAEMIDDLVVRLRAAKTGGYEWVTSPFLLDLVLRKPKAM